MKINILHSGFDGLDVSFQALITREALHLLAEAKQAAIEKNEFAEIAFRDGLIAKISPTGAKGGYAFTVDTGKDGAVYFIKDNRNVVYPDEELPPDFTPDWNVRVSLRSAMLAKYGYKKAQEIIYYELTSMGLMDIQGERIARVDICVDFYDPKHEFSLEKVHFAHHSRSRKVHQVQQDVLPETKKPTDEISIESSSKRVTSITVGKMPNMQTIIYDKTLEIAAKRKGFWWHIWDFEKHGISNPKENFGGTVWRVEVRGGKDFLKKQAKIRTWRQLEEALAEAVQKIMHRIRMYVRKPEKHENITRLAVHPIWEAVRFEAITACKRLQSGKDVDVVTCDKEERITMLNDQIYGCLLSLGALEGKNFKDMQALVSSAANRFTHRLEEEKVKSLNKFNNSRERYRELQTA